MNKAEALADCIRHMEMGGNANDCLVKYPDLGQELRATLATWLLVTNSMPPPPALMPVSRQAFRLQLSRDAAVAGLPIPMKIAGLAATAAVASLVLTPGGVYSEVLSVAGSLAWLSWWVHNFVPRLRYAFKAASA